MSDREFRIVKRVDYSQSGRNSRRRPLDSYSQAREPPRDSDDSSDETHSSQSESDSSTVVQHESDLGCSLDLSQDFRRLTMENNAAVKKLFAAQESLRDDINDLIDENTMDHLLTIDDVKTFVVKLEEARSKYRNVYKEICNLIDEDDGIKKLDELKYEYDGVLKSIKVVLADAKNVKIAMQNFEANTVAVKRADEERIKREEYVRKASSVAFLFTDVDRLFTSINEEIDVDNVSTDRNIVDDDELIEMRKRLPALQQRIENLSSRCKELVGLVTDPTDANIVKVRNISQLFDAMLQNKTEYVQRLKDEIRVRECNKEKRFQSSSLNINLLKFKGYDSPLDYYTFKNKFMLRHSQDVPVKSLPEFLKNQYLEGPALESVKRLQNIDEIWDALKKEFGDPRVMLSRKISELDCVGALGKTRDSEKIKDGLNKVVNIMQDLMRLAEDHRIEEKLYYGETINSIYRTIGDVRTTKFIEKNCEESLDGSELWKELLKFLEKDIKVQLEKSMIYRTFPEKTPKDERKSTSNNDKQSHHTDQNPPDPSDPNPVVPPPDTLHTTPPSELGSNREKRCHLCDKTDHVATKGPYGKKLIQYFSCKDFAEATCAQRFTSLKQKSFCTQCLMPGASSTNAKHAEGRCQNTYVCTHESHNAYAMKKHVLVCEEHKDTQANQTLLEEYRARCINRRCNTDLPDYSRTIHLAHHCAFPTQGLDEANVGRGIYQFQQIKIRGDNGEEEIFNLFYDNGCRDSVITYDAKENLKKLNRVLKTKEGNVALGGVGGGIAVESPHGEIQVSLPLADGSNAVIGGLVIDQITHEFPTYPLTEVERDVRKEYGKSNDIKKLPRLPPSVGGQVDIMIGVQYLRYFPVEFFKLFSGLTIYLSPFLNIDGSRGVIAGPHPKFGLADSAFYTQPQAPTSFFTFEMQQIRGDLSTQISIKNYNEQVTHDIENELSQHDYINCNCCLLSRTKQTFEESQNAGSEISYRCPKCRNCQDCKCGEKIELDSVEAEAQQYIINNSVRVDLEAKVTSATLPFIEDPITSLTSNRQEAMRVYDSQVRKLNKDPQAKSDVLKSEGTLQQLGFVDYVKNLTDDQRKRLFGAALKYFIPWRAVWNMNSISTPCRVVFDATMPTKSGKGLNNVLAKGRNTMNRLVEIVLRWFTRRVGFHTDVKKMYNSVKLEERDWCYQMYFWQDELDSKEPPEIKVIKTLMYGVKPSGNQAERGMREAARMQSKEYPRACQVVTSDMYVDDCASGEDNVDDAYRTADELSIVLSNAGYHLKGFTFSGKPPPEHLSRDGKHINVIGYKWDSEEDTIQLDIGELNFATKQRGKKPATDDAKRVPKILTRKHCHAKVAEIFDIAGKLTPITAGMKLDLHDFVDPDRVIQWKDKIPDELRPVWLNHFEMIKEIPTLRYNRTIIPEDAVSLEIETIDTGDASQAIACIAIYARMKRRCGTYSCQLVFSRSKILEKGITQPRAELVAAMLNAYTGEVVKRSFGDLHKGAIKLGDSTIVLHWINNGWKLLKQYVRSRVIEILRFTERAWWYYVESSLMIADLGTRRGVTLKQVDKDSDWVNGYEWMSKEKSDFPIIPVTDLVMSSTEKDSYQKELFAPYNRKHDFEWPQAHVCDPGSMVFLANRFNHEEIKARYKFSQYVVDPNRCNFSIAVLAYAYVKRFVRNFKMKVLWKRGLCTLEECTWSPTGTTSLTEDEINDAYRYFYNKATQEVLNFTKESEYKSISKMKDDVLYYTGRILPTQRITFAEGVTMTDVMKDLSSTTFCVPIVDAHSPIAYSIVNEVHWAHKVAKHRGVETVYRYVLQVCYIVNGRGMVKMFGQNCERCRYLAKRTIEIEMGPVSGHNLTIAPAFYITQVDIAGPFTSYSPQNKRTTVKIYLAVFCCCVTSAVSLKVMENYDAASFMLSFIRLSCNSGVPKILISDTGSQLVKGYGDMRIDFTDLRNQLHRQESVEFEIIPVGGHNMTGKVERVIKEAKSSIERSYDKQRFSIIQWETIGDEIANTINDMPLALRNLVSDFEEMDLVTPNRLKIGRNNNRSPIGPLYVTNDPTKFFAANENIFNTWFEAWLTSHVHKLMPQPKWYKTSHHIKEGDIVLFLKKEGKLNTTYQYGMVKTATPGKDGIIRKAILKYRNHTESVDRETCRAVRQLVVIHSVNELNIIQELGKIATAVDMKKALDG